VRLAVALLLALLAAGVQPAQAVKRSYATIGNFKRLQPCPATGQARGPCPGWVIDHVQPLCAGGPDHPRNMQWQTVADAKVKDRLERAACGGRKRSGQDGAT
jgi:hypothetical protein